MPKTIAPARNVREYIPKTCYTCLHGKMDGAGCFFCERPGGPEWDVSEGLHHLYTCDLWAAGGISHDKRAKRTA